MGKVFSVSQGGAQDSEDSDSDVLNDDQLLGAILKTSQQAQGKTTESANDDALMADEEYFQMDGEQ